MKVSKSAGRKPVIAGLYKTLFVYLSANSKKTYLIKRKYDLYLASKQTSYYLLVCSLVLHLVFVLVGCLFQIASRSPECLRTRIMGLSNLFKKATQGCLCGICFIYYFYYTICSCMRILLLPFSKGAVFLRPLKAKTLLLQTYIRNFTGNPL